MNDDLVSINKQESDSNLQSHNIPPSNVRFQTLSTFTGPLPPPDILAQYESILPGSAERLLARIEQEQNHRLKTIRFNTILSFLYGLVVCGVTFYAIFKNYPGIGTAIIGLHVGLVGGKLAVDYKLTSWRKNNL